MEQTPSCKKNEIIIHKYHHWNHRIIENLKSNKETTFAEIALIYSNAEDTISK